MGGRGVQVARLQDVQCVAGGNPYSGSAEISDLTRVYGSARSVTDFMDANPINSLNGNAQTVKDGLEGRLAVFRVGLRRARSSQQLRTADETYFARCDSNIRDYRAALSKYLRKAQG